jgi:hypothetical protein
MLFVAASSGEPMDIVVLYDTSRNESLAHFEQTRDYISGDFLREFVRKGDTFHLISFGDTPRLELSRRIDGEGDYRTIIGRLLLLYPLAQSSSVENAAGYAETFISELPPERNKKVVFFTAKNGFSPAELNARFNEHTQTYLASLPATFSTLSSGRIMTPPVAAAHPPARNPAAVPEDESAKPDAPPLEPLETILPEVSIMPFEPLPMVLPSPDGDYEPVLFDKFKAAMIILPASFALLFCILIFAGSFTWKKPMCANTYPINLKDCLYLLDSQLNKNAAPKGMVNIALRHGIFFRGLLQKASKINEQTL